MKWLIFINKECMAGHKVGGRKKVNYKIIISTDTFGWFTLLMLKVSFFSTLETATKRSKNNDSLRVCRDLFVD